MALRTIADLIDDCLDEIPGCEQAPLVRAVNKVIRRIQTEFVEPVRSTFTTLPSISTGTVAVTQDATLVTFSGTPLASTDPLSLIQISGDEAWFPLTYASTSTGNLASKWGEDTDAAATYMLVKPTVSFPANVGEILKIQRPNFTPLIFRPTGSCPWLTGVPQSWSPYYHDSASASPNDDLLRIFLDPAPTERMVYEYWYKPRTAALTPGGSTTQAIPFSDLWYEAIVQGTLFFLWKREADKSKVVTASVLYEEALSRARGSALPAAVIPRTNRNAEVFAVDRRPVERG